MERESVLTSEVVIVESDPGWVSSIETRIAKIIVEHFGERITHTEADAGVVKPALRSQCEGIVVSAPKARADHQNILKFGKRPQQLSSLDRPRNTQFARLGDTKKGIGDGLLQCGAQCERRDRQLID